MSSEQFLKFCIKVVSPCKVKPNDNKKLLVQ